MPNINFSRLLRDLCNYLNQTKATTINTLDGSTQALVPAEAAENNKKYFVAKSKQYHDISLVTPCAYETKVIPEYSILLEPKISLERNFHLIAPD